MRSYDFSPLFRSTVGFDRMTQLMDAAMRGADHADGYPPYNIEKHGEDKYRITLAVAGFRPEDVEIVAQENTLSIRGKAEAAGDERQVLHRGIAARAFERKFQLADHIRVTDAEMEHGLLHVSLEREVPEALKPRRIEIATRKDKAIEDKKAA